MTRSARLRSSLFPRATLLVLTVVLFLALPSTVLASDTTAPSAPTNIVASSITQTSATLNWTASTDNVGVTGYHIYKDGSHLGTVYDGGNPPTTTYEMTGLTCGTNYSVVVVAADASNNWTVSSAATVGTASCSGAPTVSISAPVSGSVGSSTSASVEFTTTGSPTGITCKLDSGSATACSSPKTYTSLSAGSHTVTVTASNASGSTSATTTFTVDTTAPSAPTNIAASSITQTSATLNWTASTDNVGVAGYHIYKDGSHLGTVYNGGNPPATTYEMTGLTCGTNYSVLVVAADASNNWTVSSAATVTTATCATPPTVTITAPAIDELFSSSSASVEFTATNSPTSTTCALDSGSPVPCTSPQSYSDLSEGEHIVTVTVDNAAGSDSAVAVFFVDSIDPSIAITSPAEGATTAPDVDISFDVDGTGTSVPSLTCQLDGGTGAPCTSPQSYAALTPGAHSVTIEATDEADHTVSETVNFTVAVPPTVTISAPAAGAILDSTSASVAFATTGSPTIVTCKLDAASETACSSPKDYADLTVGVHTVTVTATNVIGSASATTQFAVDTAVVAASGGVLTFTSGSGQNNNLTVSLVSGDYTFTDTAATVNPGSGCSAASANQVICAETGITSLSILGLDGNDTLKSTTATTTTIDGGEGDDILTGGTATDSLIGGDGSDTLDYSSATSSVSMNLATTTAQNTGGAGTDTITSVENVVGSAFNDSITGNGAANVLSGGHGSDTLNGVAGDDTLDGGSGSDSTDYSSSPSAVTVNLATTTAQDTGGAGTDTISNVENVFGSPYDDTITGDSADNNFDGRAGDDVIDGAAGGADQVTYASATSAVTVDLGTTAAQDTGGAGTDMLTSIENVTGSGFNDTLNGTSAINEINGGDGNDSITPGAGADAITGGAGDDTLALRDLTADTANCGSGADTVTADSADSAGLTDCETVTLPSPAVITSGPTPGQVVATSTPVFAFTAPAGATFECNMDGGTLASCASPETATTLADGPHTFGVKGIDTAGEVDQSLVTRSFTVDTVAPVVVISAPADDSSVSSAVPAVTFAVTELNPGTTTCSVDGGAYSTCTSPFTTPTLSQGSHGVSVKATDAAGNVGTSSVSFTIDATALNVEIYYGPRPFSTITEDSPSFYFEAENPGASGGGSLTIECRFDTDSFAACSSPHTASSLSAGVHEFTVQASNAAGNLATASVQFEVVTTLPNVYSDEQGITVRGASNQTNDMSVETTGSEIIVEDSSETLTGSGFCANDGPDTLVCPYDASLPYLRVDVSDGTNTVDLNAAGMLQTMVLSAGGPDEISVVGNNVFVASGAGSDDISMTGYRSYVHAGAGNDTIDVADADVTSDSADSIECGEDSDTLSADVVDGAVACESETSHSAAALYDDGSGVRLLFVGADFGSQDLDVYVDPDRLHTTIEDATLPINAGVGCELDGSPQAVSCAVDGILEVQPNAGTSIAGVTVTPGDGNDSVAYDTPEGFPTLTENGDGNDTASGGDGDDIFASGPGDDVFTGGPGLDAYDASRSSAGNAISLDGAANDGVSGEEDNIGSDVERVIGSKFNDTIAGNASSNSIDGNYGNDSIEGKSGEDNLIGGPGDDDISGGSGPDVVVGGRGADTLRLGDGEIDSADCGSAVDTVVSDPADSLRACDVVSTRAVPTLTDRFDGGDHFGDEVSIGFSLADASGFECRLDEAEFEACTSPWILEDLELGGHAIEVRATGLSSEAEVIPTESVVDSFVITDTAPPMPTDASVVWNDGGVLKLDGDPFDYFNIRVTESGSDLVFESEDYDGWWSGFPASLTAWTGCEEDSQFRVTCDLTGVTSLEITTGYRDDLVESDSILPTTIDAGDGDDMVVSSAGNDHVLGGDGADRIDYSKATVGVEVDLSDETPQYTVGGGTDTLESVENLVGSNQADVLDGSTAYNVISGLDGNDTITGSDDSDELDGGAGDDELDGGEGIGTLTGGDGDDTITGGPDTDIINAGGGIDEVSSGSGEDWIQASDASVDDLVCGDEFDYDHVEADQYDTVDASCEDVNQPLGVHITSAPDPEVAIHRARATIEFVTTTSATSECAVDDGEYAECESPYTTPYLRSGSHVVSVRASSDPWTVSATTTEFTVQTGMTTELIDGTLRVRAMDGLDDELTIIESGGDLVVSNENPIEDLGLVANENCDEMTENEATCPLAEIDRIDVFAGDGDDIVELETTISTRVYAGPGDDSLTGDDPNTRLFGGTGADEFYSTGDGPSVDYSDRSEPLEISLDSTANDGEVGEGDNVSISAGHVRGGGGNDVIEGDSGPNVIAPGPGEDSVVSLGGDDVVDSLDQSEDEIDCGFGSDVLTSDLIDDPTGCESRSIETSTYFTDGLEEGERSADPEPTFEFTNPAATYFECTVDDGTPTTCSSPLKLDELDDGEHRLMIEAFDGFASLDPTPAERSFAVDRNSLSARIVSPRDETSVSTNPAISFVSEGAASVTCILDDVETADCESPFEPTTLSEDEHTLRLDVTDAHGYSIEGVDEVTFEATDDLPETVVEGIENGGATTGSDLELDFAQDASEALLFECSIDEDGFEDCVSPWSPQLNNGEHTLEVRAISSLGLVDDTPWRADIDVDSSLPSVEIVAGPTTGESVQSANVEFEFESHRTSGLECKLDSGSYQACGSPFVPNIATEGEHTMLVRALDDDESTAVAPDVATFVVDDTPPTVVPTWGAEFEVITEYAPFALESSEPGSTFECGLSGPYGWSDASVGPCESPFEWPWTEDNLRLAVVAIDPAGNRSAKSFHEFTASEFGPSSDSIAPYFSVSTEFDAVTTPWEMVNVPDSTPRVFFESSEPAAYTCSVDEGAYEDCDSGDELPSLADGGHTLWVCAEDEAENSGCLTPALTLWVDTEAPESPELTQFPADGDPGDIVAFQFSGVDWGNKAKYQLDGGEWLDAESAVTFLGLAAGSHELKYKAVDPTGNESDEEEFEWTATAPAGGPYYSLQVVSPDPGSSYVVWPAPGTPGADDSVATYEIRSCAREDGVDCSEEGDPNESAKWSDWDAYAASEAHSDGITNSLLTRMDELDVHANVVEYEVQPRDAAGSAIGEIETLIAGPWPVQAAVEQIEDESESGNLDDEFVAEDEDVEFTTEIDVGDFGAGIRGIGIACSGDEVWSGPLATVMEYPCVSPTTSTQELPVHELGIKMPGIIDFVPVSCAFETNAFGKSVASCPDNASVELNYRGGVLEEYFEFPPSVYLFVQTSNGHLLRVKSLEVPNVDGTPPDAPEDVAVGGDAAGDDGPGSVYADWTMNGDPIADEPESEGSGVDHFAVKFRINGGSWSDEFKQQTTDDLTFAADVEDLEVGDDVEFAIAAVDRVGNRSAWVAESRDVEPDLNGTGGASGASDAFDAEIATDEDADGLTRLSIYGSWHPDEAASHDEIEITVDVFDSSVEQGDPGTPISTLTKRCVRAKTCSGTKSIAFQEGAFITRAIVEITDSSSVVHTETKWTAPSTFGETVNDGGDPAVHSDSETESGEPGGASIASTRNLSTKCNPSPFEEKIKLKYNDLWPEKFGCRKALAVDGKGKRRDGSKTYLEDKGELKSYAPLFGRYKKYRRPTTYDGGDGFKFTHRYSVVPTGATEAVEKSDLHHGWPLLDSFGFTRAWVDSTSKSIVLYSVADPASPTVTTKKFAAKKGVDPITKLQGKACYRPRTSNLPSPAGYASYKVKDGRVRRSSKGAGRRVNAYDMSLIVFDLRTIDTRVRLFIPNEAFKVSQKVLRKTRVFCGGGATINKGKSQPFELRNANIGGGTRYDFSFKESPGAANGDNVQGKTYRTYNDRERFHITYAPMNTSSVFKGGVARGAIPDAGMGFEVEGFTGYCDENAFTQKKAGSVALAVPGGWHPKTMQKQRGMRWAYGEYLYGATRVHTGIHGWVPFSAIGVFTGAPDNDPKDTAQCSAGPTLIPPGETQGE